MNVYTYTEARQNLANLLDKVVEEGAVWIKRRDGQVFVVQLQPRSGSPLDIPGVDLNLARGEVLAAIQEGRRTLAGEEENL